MVNDMCDINNAELQNKLLDILKWFHNTCQEYNLRYYALGGTMLGAARHKGFIPWDDDIDVGMPRNDYEMFNKLFGDKCTDHYYVETINTDAEDFIYGYTKVYDTNTTFTEKARMNVKRGVYIDVFPLDGVSDSMNNVDAFYRPIERKYHLLVAMTCGISKRRKLYKNIAILLARMVPNLILDKKKMIRDLDKMCKSKNYDECKIIGNLLGNWGMKEIMPKEYIGVPQLYEFENFVIFGVEKYDKYLSHLYGDWRKLPPVEDQVSHHDCVECNLNKSYYYKLNDK